MSPNDTYRHLAGEYSLPVFFQPAWLDLLGVDWQVAIAYDQQVPVAVMPYIVEKKWGFTLIRNHPLTPYLGPYWLRSKAASDTVLNDLLHQLPHWDMCSIQCLPGVEVGAFFQKHGFEVRKRPTYVLDLAPSEEALYQQIQSQRRARIRKAQRDLTLESGSQQLAAFTTLHEDTFLRKGLKYPMQPKKLTEQLASAFTQNLIRFRVALQQDRLDAGAVLPFDQHTMYLLLTAMHRQQAHPGAVSLLVWEAIRTAREMGLQRFDFEGSVDPGIAEFFRSFGGRQEYYWDCRQDKSALWKLKRKLLG